MQKYFKVFLVIHLFFSVNPLKAEVCDETVYEEHLDFLENIWEQDFLKKCERKNQFLQIYTTISPNETCVESKKAKQFMSHHIKKICRNHGDSDSGVHSTIGAWGAADPNTTTSNPTPKPNLNPNAL